METEHPGVAPPRTATSPSAGPALLSVQELEQVPKRARSCRLATVQAAIDVSLIETEPEAPAARARARSKTSPAVAPKRGGPRPRGAARPAAAET